MGSTSSAPEKGQTGERREVPEPARGRPATEQGDPVVVDAEHGRIDGPRGHAWTMAHDGERRSRAQVGAGRVRSAPVLDQPRSRRVRDGTPASTPGPARSRRRARGRPASPEPSVTRAPTTTGSAPARRTRASAAAHGRTGGDDVVDHGYATAPDRLDPGRVHPQHLGAVGGDGPHRLGQGLAQVDLGGLVEDHVVVQAEGPADLDGQRDAHGGHRHHDVGPEGCHQCGRAPARPLRRTPRRGPRR